MFTTSRHEAEHFSYALLRPVVAAVSDNRHRRQTCANQLHWDEALIVVWKSQKKAHILKEYPWHTPSVSQGLIQKPENMPHQA